MSVFDPDDHEDLQGLITVSLMFFGLLRQSEVHTLKVKDITLVEDKRIVHVNFPNATKSRAHGLAFIILTHLYSHYEKYVKQLRAKDRATLADSQFLKNHIKNGLHYQNMGKDKHVWFLRKIEKFFGWPRCLTTHCWRRSAATVLANSGISVIGLKRAGRWKNLETAEHYLEHSAPVLDDRMNRLSGHKRGNDEMEWGENGEKVASMMTVSKSSLDSFQNSPFFTET